MCYGVLLRLSIIIQFTASKLQKSRLHVLLSTNTMNNISTGGCKQNVIKKKEKKRENNSGKLVLMICTRSHRHKALSDFFVACFFLAKGVKTQTQRALSL